MIRYVRIQAFDRDDPNDADQQILLDLLIDENDVAIWRFPTYGCIGLPRLNPSNFWPFAFLKDGTVLNAHEPADPGDIGETINILGKQISVGEIFTYHDGEDDLIYEIRRVTPIEEMMR